MNQAKIFQATNKLDGITHRWAAESETMEKEIEGKLCFHQILSDCIELKAEITKIQKQKHKAEKRWSYLENGLNEERTMVKNLKDITKRMKKGVRELTTWKEALKVNLVKQRKKRDKLENRLFEVHQESQLFFSRARSQVKR